MTEALKRDEERILKTVTMEEKIGGSEKNHSRGFSVGTLEERKKSRNSERSVSEKEVKIGNVEKSTSETVAQNSGGKKSKRGSVGRVNGKLTRKAGEGEVNHKRRDSETGYDVAKHEKNPAGLATLEKHVEAIRVRRNSLPRAIAMENSNYVDIVIGDDGKPIFHATEISKTEELINELTGILLNDNKDGMRTKTRIS